MTEKIKSWRHRHVRIKEEYILRRKEFDGYYDDNDEWVEDRSLPMIEHVEINCPLSDCINNPSEVFEVASDMYGVDLYRYTNSEFEVGSIEPTHQIILRNNGYPYIWDAKYFELVVRKEIWVKDEQ
jgi:hypothetical protein